jgi:hypothetical protein
MVVRLFAKTGPFEFFTCHVRESVSLTFPIDISYLIHSVGIKMILKQISKGDNHYLKKQQPS